MHYTEYTQKNGTVSIVKTIETVPFFCVYPVFLHFLFFNPYICFNPYRAIFRGLVYIYFASIVVCYYILY
jgi:hypothetical protein